MLLKFNLSENFLYCDGSLLFLGLISLWNTDDRTAHLKHSSSLFLTLIQQTFSLIQSGKGIKELPRRGLYLAVLTSKNIVCSKTQPVVTSGFATIINQGICPGCP